AVGEELALRLGPRRLEQLLEAAEHRRPRPLHPAMAFGERRQLAPKLVRVEIGGLGCDGGVHGRRAGGTGGALLAWMPDQRGWLIEAGLQRTVARAIGNFCQ